MTESTPLDTLKHAVLRGDDMLTYLGDEIAGRLFVPDDDPVYEYIDSIRRHYLARLAEHVPALREEALDLPEYVARAIRAAGTYEDGSAIRWTVIDGLIEWTVYPRLDAELLAPRARLKLLDPEFAAIVDDEPDGGDAA